MASKANDKPPAPAKQPEQAPASPKAGPPRPDGFRMKLWDAADDKRKREILALTPEQQERYSSTGVWPEPLKEDE
jgi:hypothetical protein